MVAEEGGMLISCSKSRCGRAAWPRRFSQSEPRGLKLGGLGFFCFGLSFDEKKK